MKIILMSVGTRGDMEPFIALGEILQEKGHQVICAFPEQFRDLAEDSNMKFASLGTELIELLESDIGKAAMGGSGSGFKKILAIIKLATSQKASQREIVSKQYELIENINPDRIVHNPKCIYPIIWASQNSGKTILASPVPYLHYVQGHTHVAFNSNFGPFLNKLTFSLANFGLVQTVMTTIKWLKIDKKITRGQIKNVFSSNKVIYTISPSLFSTPISWPEHMKVLGYHERNKVINWEPKKELTEFLQKHNRMLLITFGSMTNPEPEKKTKIIVEILERNKIPAIINTASGGLLKPEKYNTELIHFVSRIPYDWLLPKIYGVIHHGGSGTTHMALKYGCATMIVPHIIDQFVWNKIIFNLGVGPKGVKIGKVTVKNLEPKILELVSNSAYKKKAEQIANQMAQENFKEEIYKTVIEE
ncbi:MAG: glycosyltransferase [Cyclobacteriaceae bacterium]